MTSPHRQSCRKSNNQNMLWLVHVKFHPFISVQDFPSSLDGARPDSWPSCLTYRPTPAAGFSLCLSSNTPTRYLSLMYPQSHIRIYHARFSTYISYTYTRYCKQEFTRAPSPVQSCESLPHRQWALASLATDAALQRSQNKSNLNRSPNPMWRNRRGTREKPPPHALV